MPYLYKEALISSLYKEDIKICHTYTRGINIISPDTNQTEGCVATIPGWLLHNLSVRLLQTTGE